MKHNTWLFLFLILPFLSSYGQSAKRSVVIGSMTSKPNALLILNPVNNDQGVLLPQITSENRLLIQPSSPDEDGLVVFDITEKSFYYWKDQQWIKGLGSRDLAATYDPLTYKLTLDVQHQIDLSELKEVPGTTGMSGQFLTNDGTRLEWASLSNLGDITSIVAGAGLAGGSSQGDATINILTDDTTISINASNELEVIDKAITVGKILPGTPNTVLATNSSGNVLWQTPADDAQNLTLTSNILSLTNDATPVDLSSITLSGSNITDGTINNVDLANASVNSIKIQPGSANTILSTNGAGTVEWTTPVDAQNLGLTGNILNLTNDATPVDLSSIMLNGSNITDGTINNVDLANSSVNSIKIQPGSANTILSTNGSGTVGWITPVDADAQDLILAGNILSLTNDATPVNLNSLSLSGTNIVDGTISNVDLANASVDISKILPGSPNTVLTTNAGGNVIWNVPTDAQDISLAGNILNLTNDATPVDLNNIVAAGQVSGPLSSLAIAANTIANVHIQTGAVTINKLSTAGIVDAGKVYTTNASGVPQLELKSAIISGVTASGDLSGTYPAPGVSKIQGNQVSPGALGVPDAGKLLVWNGTQWSPEIVAGVSPIAEYYMVDPSDFAKLRRGDKRDKDNTLIYEDNSTYITILKRDEGNFIIAPIHLPHGATIEQITLYYMDRDLNNIDFSFVRKTVSGANDNVVTNWSSSGASAAIRNSLHTPIAGKEIVDNNIYSYRVIIRLDPNFDTNNSNDADHRIYAIKIRYLR